MWRVANGLDNAALEQRFLTSGPQEVVIDTLRDQRNFFKLLGVHGAGKVKNHCFRVLRFSSFYLVHLNLFVDYCLTMVAVWPFLKWFARNKMICTFGHFFAFLNVEENSIF